LRDGYGEYIKNDNSAAETNNITNYFKSVGGYCWLTGITYAGDGKTAYNTTMVMNERTINYNAGAENSAYNNDHDESYNSELPIDYKKCTGVNETDVTKQTGFFIDTAYAVITNANQPHDKEKKFHLNYSEDTRTRIDFVFNTSEEDPYYFNSYIIYINGVLSEMRTFTPGEDTFKINYIDGKYKVYLGAKVTKVYSGGLFIRDDVSDTGDCKVYSFRIYNKALTPDQLLRNYASEIPDEEKKKTFIDDNALLGGSDDGSSLAQTLPEICLIGYQKTAGGDPTINSFVMQASNQNISDLKAVREPAYLTYYNPKNNTDTEKWHNSGYTYLPIRLQFQGTSSMVYPCKNYKFKLYDPSDPEAIVNNNGTISYGRKYKLDLGNGIVENTFVLKADFMDSSHANNTGIANFVADANELSGPTPASELDPKIRTTVYGYPVLLYYKETLNSTEQHFLGVYNLNLDKSCTDSYGLDKKIKDAQGIEFDFGQAQYFDDATSAAIGLTIKKDGSGQPVQIQLFDADTSTLKDYTALQNRDGTIVGALSEKGYIRSLNNDKVRAVQCYEVKANSNANSPGGFGSFDVRAINSGMETRYPDQGDKEEEEYGDYKANV